MPVLFAVAEALEAAALLGGGERVRDYGLEQGDGRFDLKVRQIVDLESKSLQRLPGLTNDPGVPCFAPSRQRGCLTSEDRAGGPPN